MNNLIRLKDISELITKGTTPQEYIPEGKDSIRFVRVNNITKSGFIDTSNMLFINNEQNEILKRSILKENDILYSIAGAIGRSAIVKKQNLPANTNQALGIVRLDSKNENDLQYIKYALKSEFVNKQAEEEAQGGAQANLNLQQLGNLQFWLPKNLKEQKKIAEILTSVDKVIELTEIEIKKLKNLKKGMMQDLLTKGIGHTKFKDSPIGKIPESWETSTFKENCKVRQGLQVAISERFKKDGPNRYPYITVKFIRNYANPEYIENPAATVICSSNDILMTRTGNTGEVVTNENGVFHNNFFLIDFDREKICKDYLFYYLNSSLMQVKIEIAAGLTTIPDLNHGDFYRLPLILPTYEEQEKISLIIIKVDTNLKYKSSKLIKLKNIKKGLMQDLLTGKVRVKV